MPGPKHLYLIASGDYTDSRNSAETWQCGLRMSLIFGDTDPEGNLPDNWEVAPRADSDTSGDWTVVTQWQGDGPGLDQFDPQSYMLDYAIPSAEVFYGSSAISSHCRLRTMKLSPINADGHVIDKRTVTATNSVGVPGTASGTILPLENALVVSTRTSRPGPSGRGRFYLPGVSPSQLDTDGWFKTAEGAITVGLASDYMEGLAFAGAGGAAANVRPAVIGGFRVTYATINSVRVGNYVDTQRRRRKSLQETYQDSAVSY